MHIFHKRDLQNLHQTRWRFAHYLVVIFNLVVSIHEIWRVKYVTRLISTDEKTKITFSRRHFHNEKTKIETAFENLIMKV